MGRGGIINIWLVTAPHFRLRDPDVYICSIYSGISCISFIKGLEGCEKGMIVRTSPIMGAEAGVLKGCVWTYHAVRENNGNNGFS